jgi:guanylate kinase
VSFHRVKDIQVGVARGIIVTAPSGSGKTTIVRHLLTHFKDLAFSVSATTRPRRQGEIDGEDYHFLSDTQFQALVDAGGFLEWEEVYPGNRYGTLKSEVAGHTDAGKVVVFDLDVYGALKLKSYFGDNGLSLFVQSPSVAELRKRLEARGSETEDSLLQRLSRAQEEGTHAHRFDAILVNDDLSDALAMAEEVVKRWLHHKG